MSLKTAGRRRFPLFKSFSPKTPGRAGLLFAVLALLALAGGDRLLGGRIVSVADGDTLNVYTSLGRTERVRLYGIDCPENAQDGGGQAAEFTRSLALFRKAELSVMDRDVYGRTVAVVILEGGQVLNEELLRHGHAWLYTRHCKDVRCRYWKELEADARKSKSGLWAGQRPVPPWKWRATHRR